MTASDLIARAEKACTTNQPTVAARYMARALQVLAVGK